MKNYNNLLKCDKNIQDAEYYQSIRRAERFNTFETARVMENNDNLNKYRGRIIFAGGKNNA